MIAHLKRQPVVRLDCCLFLWIGSLVLAFAQGGPPLITDDTGTPGDRQWEIEVATTSEIRHSDDRQFEVPLLDLNYGVGPNIELTYELPLLLKADRDEASSVGLGDSLVGAKWRFLDESKTGVSASIYPQFTFNNPTASVRRGLVANDQDFFLPLEVQKTVGPLEINLEVDRTFIFTRPTNGMSAWPLGTASASWNLWGKSTAQPWSTSNRTMSSSTSELAMKSRKVIVSCSVGRSVHSDHTPQATFLSYTGIEFDFDLAKALI